MILALGMWCCESIRPFCDLLSFDKVRSRYTHIYFRGYDLARCHCPIRYDKIRSDEIVQIEFPIGSRSDPIITRPRLLTLVYVQIRSYVTLRYVYHKPLCYEGCSRLSNDFLTINNFQDWMRLLLQQ